jgi:DNA repair photolyase
MSTNKPRHIEYETMKAKTILNPVKAPSMPFDWSINPYRGCQHGCSFCYARSTHSFLGMEADDTFQNHILLKSDAPAILRQQLLRKLRGRKPVSAWGSIAIGTATDPYQQIESKMKLTRGCLEVLAEFQIPVSITTRSPLILRDLDILRKLPGVTVNLSVSTLNRTVWRQFEPSTPSPSERLHTIERLASEGINAGVFTAPILPYLTDSNHDLEALITAVSQAGAQFLMPSYLRLSTASVKVWFYQTLRQHYPQLTEKYAKLYQDSAYAPSSFRDPVMHYIDSLLNQHGLQVKKIVHLAQKASNAPHNSEEIPGPVQLTLF